MRMLPVEILKERTREADRKKRDRAEDNEKRKRKRLEQQRELLEQGVLRCPRCARDRPGPGVSARLFPAACRAHCRAHRCNADAVGPMKTPRVHTTISGRTGHLSADDSSTLRFQCGAAAPLISVSAVSVWASQPHLSFSVGAPEIHSVRSV